MKKNQFSFFNAKGVKMLALASGLLASATIAEASTDYGPAAWRPVCSGHWYSSGYGKRFYVIHDIEGYYWSCIYYFQRCSTGASVHYTTNGKKDNSTDSAPGAVTQMVRDSYYAWHARCWNQYSMGTEHEGFVSNPAWYTEAQYVASASITKSKCNKYGLTKNRNRVIGHDQKRISAWRSWMYASGYSSSFVTCNDHTDPGLNWKWTHYMDLVNGVGSTPSAPSSLKATTYSSSRIDLTWTDNSSIESGFKVERKTGSGGTYSQIGTTASNDRTFSSTGLASGTLYYFRVRAYNGAGNSGYSNSAGATTKDTIPAAPTSLTATAVSNDQINLGWAQSMPNEDGFRIYRSANGTNYTLVATVGINATSYSNTGLAGNTKYWYKVHAYNTAGNSAASNVASDTTAPQAPSALTVSAVPGTTNWNKLDLAWTDNAGSEVGFKIERATAVGGPYTQIATNAASDRTYQNTGLAATTTYYYRVRAYNGNGNSDYSNIASRTTGNIPPVLNAIGNKTVANSTTLAFTVTASDPNAPAPVTTTWQNFTSFPHNTPNETVLFNKPLNSASTSAFIDAVATNYTSVRTNGPSAWGTGNKAMLAGWTFKTGMANYWVRLNTFNTPTNPNPAIALDQKLQFKYYANHTTQVGIGVRETSTTAAYGANGGSSGSIEWVGVTNVVSGNPIPNTQVALATPATLVWNIPFAAQAGFTGDGVVLESGAKGTLEHVVIRGLTTGAHTAWFDDFAVVTGNNLAYTLDAGAPAGASIGRRTGKFSWTPTVGQVGVHNITVRVTDNLGAQDFELIKVTVTGTGNAAPVLAAIGSKTVKEGLNLAFTASATDANGNTLTYTLEGNPSGSSINSSSGAFSWTPTEAQGAGSYPITVRVTDNGSPASNDFEVVTVTVQEVNLAPVLNAIADQTISEGGTVNVTAVATDADVPANTITYSVAGPVGMTINPSSGAISYTATEDDGGDVIQVTVTAKDNGNPVLSATKTFNVTVNDGNNAPTIIVGTKSDYNPFAIFDELDDEGVDGHNNSTLFRVPYFSSSTTAHLNSTSYSYVTNGMPDPDVNASYQALYVNMSFNTGTTNPWCRLTTFTSSGWTNSFGYPNPTILLGQHVRFKVWANRSIKIAIGVRETGTGNPVGFNGGISGQIEWVGATATGSPAAPVPSRTITASNWTQVDFNLPSEVITAFPGSGNGLLAAGKGVLEHLAIVPNNGTGSYTLYLDDFEVLTTTTANPITVDTLNRVTFTTTATDPDLPAQNFLYSSPNLPTALVWDEDLQQDVLVTNASFAAVSGEFVFSPVPTSASSNLITLTVTDDGSPNLSSSANVTVLVNKINTPPRLAKLQDQVVENGGGSAVTFDASAKDDDVPANTLTFSLSSAPSGATIDPSTGVFNWTPPAGNSTNFAVVRVTDNGTPSLWDEQTVAIYVATANTAPSLSLGTIRATEKVINYETMTDMTNERVMFNKPSNSATTSSFIDTALGNTSYMTNNGIPAGNPGGGTKSMRIAFGFKTGMTNPWLRLNTQVIGTPVYIPNPTINASARLKFDIHSSQSIKVCLGIRETGTSAQNGADGGTTGTIEFVGAATKIGSTPQPSRTVNANVWTTLEFDLPNEPKVGFTGDGILNAGQQVLEELALVSINTGAHVVYVDNFEVVTTAVAGGTLAAKAGSTVTLTASATDPNPGAGLTYGLDADFAEIYTNAVINETNGAFTWTPSAAEVGLTIPVGIIVDDNPTDGGVSKSDTESFSVTVSSDTLATQGGGTFVSGGDTVILTWDSTPGAGYDVQSKAVNASGWSTVQTVTATGSSSSVSVTNGGDDANYRVVEAGGGSGE